MTAVYFEALGISAPQIIKISTFFLSKVEVGKIVPNLNDSQWSLQQLLSILSPLFSSRCFLSTLLTFP